MCREGANVGSGIWEAMVTDNDSFGFIHLAFPRIDRQIKSAIENLAADKSNAPLEIRAEPATPTAASRFTVIIGTIYIVRLEVLVTTVRAMELLNRLDGIGVHLAILCESPPSSMEFVIS